MQRRKRNDIILPRLDYTERSDNTRVAPIIPLLIQKIEERNYERNNTPLKERIQRERYREQYEKLLLDREESKKARRRQYEKQLEEREALRAIEDEEKERLSRENKELRDKEEADFWKSALTDQKDLSLADKEFLDYFKKFVKNPITRPIAPIVSKAWFGLKDRLGSIALSSIKTNGENIASRIGFNDMHGQFADAHEQMLDWQQALDNAKKLRDDFMSSTGYRPESLALDPTNKELQELQRQYDDYTSTIKSVEWAMNQDPNLKSMDDAYKLIYAQRNGGWVEDLKSLYKGLVDLTTYPQYKDYVANKRLNEYTNKYDTIINNKYSDQSGKDQLSSQDPNRQSRIYDFDRKEIDSFRKQLAVERKDLQRQYEENREHLAKSTEYWKVRDSYIKGEQLHQNDKIWDLDYWSMAVPTMIGSTVSSGSLGLSMGIQAAAAAAGVAEAASGAGALAPWTMLAAQAITTPLDWIAMYDENYAETGTKRILSIKNLLLNPAFVPESDNFLDGNDESYKEIMRDLKTKSKQYWLDKGLKEDYIDDYLLGQEGDENVLRDLVGGLISSTDPRVLSAMIESTRGLEAQLQTNNIRTGSEMVIQKLLLTPGIGSLKRAGERVLGTTLNSIEKSAVEGVRSTVNDLSRGKIIMDDAGRATVSTERATAESVGRQSGKYKNGFRRQENTLSESVAKGATTGATIGDMLGLGVVGEAIGSVAGGTLRGAGHLAKEMMPARVRNVFYTMQEGFARKYADVYDKLMPTSEWSQFLLKYGYNQVKASAVSSMSERAEEAVQYLNEKEDFASKYGWSNVNFADLLAHDFKQGGRVLNSYMALFGLSNSELLDDAEYWANGNGGAALGFLHNAMIGGVMNIANATTEAKIANEFTRAHIMDRELNKLDRILNVEIARQTIAGKGGDVIRYLQGKMREDSRRENPRFSQEDYDEIISAANTIVALANNKAVTKSLQEKGILKGSENHAIALADMYSNTAQLAENKRQFEENRGKLTRIYNNALRADIMRSYAEQAFELMPEKQEFSEEEKEIWIENYINSSKALPILYSRLQALVNLRAKHNTIEDFFTAVSDKFKLRTKRPDAKLIHKSIDELINQVVDLIKQVDSDFNATTDKEMLDYVFSNAPAFESASQEEVEELEQAQAMLMADLDVINAHSMTMEGNNYKRRIEAIKEASARNALLDWAVNDIYEGDAVTDLIDRVSKERALKEAEDALNAVKEQQKEESTDPLEASSKPVEEKISNVKENLSKNKQKFERRKQEAKERYHRRRDRYNKWRRGNLNSGIPFMDTIVNTSQMLLRGAEVGVYKFQLFVNDIQDIYEDINVSDVIPILKQAYIHASAKYQARNPQVLLNLSTVDEVVAYVHDVTPVSSQPDVPVSPLHERMQKRFNEDSEKIISSVSSHFDIITEENGEVVVYRNEQAITNSNYSTATHSGIRQLVDTLRSLISDENQFKAKLQELQRSNPNIDVEFYTKNRRVDGMLEAIARKYYDQSAQQFIINGKKVLAAVTSILLDKEIDASQYPANYLLFVNDILQLKDKLTTGLGLTILNTEKYIYGTLPDGRRVASQADIIAADNKNRIWIIDVRSGYKSILGRIDRPGYYTNGSIREEVKRGLDQIEAIINAKFEMPVQASYLLPVLYDDYQLGIQVEKLGDQMLVPFKQTLEEQFSNDLNQLKTNASKFIEAINLKIRIYNVAVDEVSKYTDTFAKIEEVVEQSFNTVEEYQQYMQQLSVKDQNIEDAQERVSTAIQQSIDAQNEAFQEIQERSNISEIKEDVNSAYQLLTEAVKELDICSQYIPEVRVTNPIERENVKAIYVALFEALRRLNDFMSIEGSEDINIQAEQECIASVMERMAEHPESFGRENIFVRRWWLNNFVLSPRTNTAFQVRNQFEQVRAYTKMINSWVNTFYTHVLNDLDDHRELLKWYSSLFNGHFKLLLQNAQTLSETLDDTSKQVFLVVIQNGLDLITKFNATWGAPADEEFATPPADELERISRMPVKWTDLYGESQWHSPAPDAMLINGGYWSMSLQPDFLDNIKFNFYIVPRDRKIAGNKVTGEYTLHKGDVAVYIEYKGGKYFADLPFLVDPKNYPNPSLADLLRFAQINRGNVRFMEKLKAMLVAAAKNGLRVTADVSVNKGEIKYDPVGTINNVASFLFKDGLNAHTIHSTTVSDADDIGVLYVRDNRALGTKTYEIRTGSKLERFLSPFNDKYDKDDPYVRSGLLIYMYKTGDGLKIAVPMPTTTIGGTDAVKIASLIHRYILGERTIDGFDILTLIKLRVYVHDPAKPLSIYNSKTNMIQIVANGIMIGDEFYDINEKKQEIVDKIAHMSNVADVARLNKQLISSSDGVFDVAYSRLASGASSVELPNGFVLTIDNFRNNGTFLGYLMEKSIVGTRASGTSYKLINFGNPYFITQQGEKLYQLKQGVVPGPAQPSRGVIKDVDDPFAQLGNLPMTVEESSILVRSDEEITDFRREAERYFKQVLGNNAGEIRFSPKQQTYLKKMSGSSVAVGVTTDAFVQFSMHAPYETIQHEAFHKIMELLLPEEEREYFYKQYKKWSFKAVTPRDIAEGLTDLFVDYTLKKEAINKNIPFWKQLKPWFNFCKFMLGAAITVGPVGLKKTLRLYHDINAGEYAKSKYSITKEASNRFKELFGEGLYYEVLNTTDNRKAEFQYIADSGELQHMVAALSYYIMETMKLSDPNPNVESIRIDESTPNLLEAVGEDGKPIIDSLTGKDLPDSELTTAHLAFREVLESEEKEVKNNKGEKIATTRVYPKFAAISDRVSQYIASIFGELDAEIEDFEQEQIDDSGENEGLTQGMGNESWGAAAYEINKLHKQSKLVRLFLGTIPYVTRDQNGKIIYDVTKNIYGVPMYMPISEVYNTVTNDLNHVKSILELRHELLRLEKVSPMYHMILNKFNIACTGMWTRNEEGTLVIDYDKEAFAISLTGAISSQKMDFIIASSRVDDNGSKNIKIVQSFLGRDARKLPALWTRNIISGQIGPFSRNRDANDNLLFAGGKVYPNRTDVFSKTADFIVEMRSALMKSGEQTIAGTVYNVDLPEDISRLKSDLVKMFHGIGIVISENTIDYILLNDKSLGASKADRDAGKRGLLNWITLTGNTSVNPFIDLLNDFVFDSGIINLDVVKEGYTESGFVSYLAEWLSKYNKASVDLRALALNGKELNMISQNNSISKRVESYNTIDQNNPDVRKLLQFGYNVIQGEKSIGSIIAKHILDKDEDLHLKCHVYIGFKTDNKGDMGQEYTQLATIDDYMAKFTMLLNNYMISPALADKGTYVVISGLEIPGMQFLTITDKKTKEEKTVVTGAPTIRFFNKQPYIVPQRSVLSLIREYMITERLAILRCMADLGYKDIPGYEDEGRVPIPEGAKIENYHTPHKDKATNKMVEPNGTRFWGLTLVTVKENGKLVTYVLNDPNESSVKLLKDANDHFFNLGEEEQLDAIALTLHAQTMAAVRRAEELGVVERIDMNGKWKDASGTEKQLQIKKDEESLMNIDSKYLNLKQIQVLTAAIMKQLAHAEFGTWADIPASFGGENQKYASRAADLISERGFRSSVARSLAIAAIINDVTMRSIISTEEYLRCFIGNPGFFGVKYDMDGHKIQDSAYDMQKRIGGLISTGDDNIIQLPYMKLTYVVGEIQDYIITSKADVAENLQQMFADSMVREIYAIKTGNWNRAYSEENIESLISDADDAVKPSLERAKQRAYEYADMVTHKVDVADGAAYITANMCKDLLRIHGDLTNDVVEAFRVLEEESNTKDNWMKKRDAYNTIYEKVNLVAYKYTAYGFRDHTLNGDVVSDITVPYYDKFALFPLFKGMATGPMLDIYQKMLDEGVDMCPMHSGVKVGSQAPVDYEDGEIKASFNKYEQHYSDIRKLLNTEPEEGDVIPVGTQMAKIVLLNLRTPRPNYMDVRTGATLSGQQLLDKFMDAINKLSVSGGLKIADQFFEDGTIIPDEEKLGKYFADQLTSRNANKATVEAIRLVKNEGDHKRHMLAPLAATADASWIESILISKINKAVIDIDLPGSSYILRSAFAMEGKRKSGEGLILNENEIDFTINNGKKLQFLNKDNSMDAVISMDYFDRILFKGKLKNMSFEEKKQWLIDHDIIGENARANTVGYRIPTQAESSIHALRFVDVIPGGLTTIILPEEFVTITGADYDIDHLYLVSYNYNTYISEDGQDVVTTSFNPVEDEGKFSDKYYQNVFVDCLMTLLKDPLTVGMLYRPIDGDTEPIKKIAGQIQEEGSTKNLPYNFDTLHELVIRKNDYITGNDGIAPMALNVTSHQMSRSYHIPFRQTKFTKAVGLISLDGIVDKDDIYIDSWLSGFINAHVDIVKDAYISKLNVNQFTYNMLNLLIRAGFGDVSVWFLAQPIIRDMSEASNRAKSRYATDQELSRSQYAEEQYLIEQAVSKYIPEQYLEASNIEKYTISNDPAAIRARIGVVNFIKDNVKVLEAIAKNPKAETVTIDGVLYDVANILATVFFAWKSLEKYAKAISNFIHFSKIDTRKHGKTLIEIARYRDGFNKLYFPEDPDSSIFEVNALLKMAYHSWIYTKTLLAINLPMRILANQVFDANPEFVKAVFGFANYLSTTGGALNVETVKKISRHMRTAVKADYFVSKYIPELLKPGQTVSQYIRSLFIGPNSMNSRLTRLKYHIENNPKYQRLANNHLINQIYPEIQEENTFAYGRFVEKPSFISILNNVDNSKINGDLLTDGWEDLLRDEDPFVRSFAHDLIVYSFFTSGEFRGWNKMLKYVPANWILGVYNNGLLSYADYIREALLKPAGEYYKYRDIIMANLATDPKIVGKMPLKNSDGTENFIGGNETIKLGKPLSTIQEAKKYIMVRDGAGYSVSNYAMYKLVDYFVDSENVGGAPGPEFVVPIYARMKIRGYHYTSGYDIYEYGFDLNYGENGKDAAAKFDDIAALTRIEGAVDKYMLYYNTDALKDVYYDKYQPELLSTQEDPEDIQKRAEEEARRIGEQNRKHCEEVE